MNILNILSLKFIYKEIISPKKITAIQILALALFFAVCLGGCHTKVDVVHAANQKENKIDKINFFMETSGSMAGYLKGSTDFAKTIPNLLVAIENKTDSVEMPLHNYFISDSVTSFKGKTRDFIYALSTQKAPKDKSSEMDKIFKMIADKTDSNDISIFVSDCILSYSDKDIQTHPEINIEKAEAGLKPLITSTFDELQKKNDICASIYGFNSSFDGTYYTYKNGRLPINFNVKRPYYIWVLGNRELLKKFNVQLKKLEQFKPDLIDMDFGIFNKPINDYDLFFKLKKGGEWEPDNKGISNAVISKNNPLTFAISLDLSSLPDYAKDTAYLIKNLNKNKETADFKVTRVLLKDNINRADLKKNELDAYNNATHIFIFEVDNIYKPKGEIAINLPLDYDTSYRKLSIMDDRKLADISGKTFAFQYLVDGVRAAYQNPNQYFINIIIPIKK